MNLKDYLNRKFTPTDPIEAKIRQEMKLLQLLEPSSDLLYDCYVRNETESLYHPDNYQVFQPTFQPTFSNVTIGGWVSYKYSHKTYTIDEFKEDSQPFETNMMEALIGWRSWKIDYTGKRLMSQNGGGEDCYWHPDEQLTAKCNKEPRFDPNSCGGSLPPHESPAEFCTCGIYAKDILEYLGDGYPGIYGQVYGWGRYVRGDRGFRCQFAYPKNFYVTRDKSPDVIDILKQYHVPIFIEQPQLLYNPEEDGYEYRQDDQDWHFRAAENTDTDED